MRNIVVLLSLLVVPYAVLALFRVKPNLRGRIAVALVFLFTGVGHFVKTDEMTRMLPSWVPARELLVYATGVLEIAAAIALLIPASSRLAGIFLCVFLVVIFPANIFAAIHRVDFGGHEFGPIYLAIRLPLQLLLIGWVWWFAVRRPSSANGRS